MTRKLIPFEVQAMNIPRPKFCTVVSPDEYDYKRVPVCKHERGWIENHRRFPATYEMPSEETGRVHCSGCDEEWTLGYEPSGIELNAEKYNSEHPEEAR